MQRRKTIILWPELQDRPDMSFEKIADYRVRQGRRAPETELELKKGNYIYEVEILDGAGKVWELKLNAKTGECCSSKSTTDHASAAVEDDPTLGPQIRSSLQHAGYAVDLSVDGIDAEGLAILSLMI